jgi:hypothetical protein
MYKIQQGLIKDPTTLTNVMDSCGSNVNLVEEKTIVFDTYLDVSEPFDTVPLKNITSKMNLF